MNSETFEKKADFRITGTLWKKCVVGLGVYSDDDVYWSTDALANRFQSIRCLFFAFEIGQFLWWSGTVFKKSTSGWSGGGK